MRELSAWLFTLLYWVTWIGMLIYLIEKGFYDGAVVWGCMMGIVGAFVIPITWSEVD